MNDIAGWITLGTKLDNKNLEKQLNEQKRKLQKYAKEQEKLMEQKEQFGDLKKYEDEIRALEEVIKKREEFAKKWEETEGRPVKASFGIETLELKDKLTDINAKYQEQKQAYDEIDQKIVRNTNDIATMNTQIAETEKKLKKGEGWEEVKRSIEDSSKSLTKLITKTGKYALAIFGIRGAYTSIRSAMSIISQYDKQMATDIEYIRYTLAMTLKPVIEWLLQAVVKLLQYVNYLAKAWFNVSLFSANSAKDFQKAKNGLSGANKEAKKLKKTLAGFDELNILNDPSQGNGALTPSFELGALTELKDSEVPQWLLDLKEIGKWIIDNWPLVIGILAGTAVAITAIKYLIGTPGGAGILGVAAALASISLLISSLSYMIETLSSKGMDFYDVLSYLAVVFGSIIALMAAIALLGPAMSAGLVPFSILLLEISAVLIVMALTIPTILDALGNFIVKIGPSMVDILKTIYDGIASIVDIIGTKLVEVINSVGDLFTKVFNGIAKVVETIGNTISKILNTAAELVGRVLSAILNFIRELGPAINNFVDNAIKAVTKLINFLISGIEYLINTLVIGAINGLIKGINKIIPGNSLDINMVKNVSIPRFKPKLASGGIVDIPKTGFNLGNAIVGERGREGVLPLTNPDTMTMLGREIAKWIPINLDITNTIDGRVLNKRLEQINANNSFARNGAR